MWQTIVNAFRDKDIRKKILITFGLLLVFRIGCYIPLPGLDVAALKSSATNDNDLIGVMNLISGGSLQNGTLFALGVLPYINSFIIMQLLTLIIPKLEKLSKEGEEGRRKLTRITRYTGAGIALVIAVYLLLSRRSLARKSKKLLYAYLAKPHADRVCHIAGLVQAAYTKFLSGQCIEACILGVLIFLAFSAFGLPYAGLIGFLTAISAFIPYVGAFVACVIGALLILLSSPEQALISVLVFLVVQFVENLFIYPNVVGTSVGLPPLFTFLAALIGGNLFGILGMLIGVPFAATIYQLLKNDVYKTQSKA